MNKKVKKIVVFLLVVVVLAIVGFYGARYYAYHAGKRDVKSEAPAFTLTSKAIVDEFMNNSETANKKFINKPIVVEGFVTSINKNQVIVDDVVVCDFVEPNVMVKQGQKVAIKGRLVGFDDLMGEIKLDECSLNK